VTLVDYRGKVVLVTGGTKGIGLACGLEFGRRGAHVVLTHRWGSADEVAIAARFSELGAPAPMVVEADASQTAETRRLLDAVGERHGAIDVLIANVCVVMRGDGVENHSLRALTKSLDYSSWPFVEYLHEIHRRFGRYPGYAVAMSSDGPDRHYPGYDYVAVSKAVLETFVRYMSTHLRADGVKVNALRTRQVVTDSYRQIFGDAVVELAERFPEFAIDVDEVARTTYALCSGMLDAMSGQVVLLDGGAQFVDNIMTLGPRLLPAPEPR
jgi:NAD(P)-dependent dehydrogenase (short-subunit alcohol dehydrogenase family)